MCTLTSPAAARIAGQVATVGFAVAILLQLLLAAGVLPLSMAWGGSQAVPASVLRVARLVAVASLAFARTSSATTPGLPGRGLSLPRSGSWPG